MNEKGGASEKKIRVALFGAGKMATHHAKAIRLLENASLVAVADPALADGERKKEFPGETEIYLSAEELLDRVKPEVVHICTPPATHGALAKLALQFGAHIYVEKPFTLTAHEAMEIISLAKNKGLKVCAGHQLLFESPALRADESLAKLGRIIHIESYFSFKPVRRSQNGRSTISPLDQLVDILPHPVYTLLHFLKKNTTQQDIPVRICALEVRTAGSIHGILRCGDVTGILTVTLEGRPIESYLKVVGVNGSLYIDFVRGALVVLPGPGVSAITKILNPYKQSWQITSKTTRALFRRVFKKQKSYPGLFEIISKFYDGLSPNMQSAISPSSIVETVTICENVTNKLKVAEREENSIAEKELHRLESELTPPDRARGGVLITGGTGMLGKVVASELRKENWYTRVIARKIPPVASRIPGVEYVVGDLAENISPEILKDISIVVHCAAETAGGKDAHTRNSINATKNILTATAKAGVKKFLHISSIAVLKTSYETGTPVDENTPLVLENEDRGPYVWGKALSERLSSEMGSNLGIEIRVIRPGPLINYESFEAPGRLGREIGPLFIYFGSGKSKLSVCDVKTAANVIRKYVEDFHSMPPVLNLVEPIAPTRAELVSLLLKIRPDLKAISFPFILLKILSPCLILMQRILRPSEKPVDIYAAFSSERYNSNLAAQIINQSLIT